MNMLLSLFFAATMWVQVPQWSDDWSNCAVMSLTAVAIGILSMLTIPLGGFRLGNCSMVRCEWFARYCKPS